MLIQLPTYAENAALPASAATPAVQQSINRSTAGTQQLNRCMLPQLADGTEGRTDRHVTDVHCTVSYYVGSAKCKSDNKFS